MEKKEEFWRLINFLESNKLLIPEKISRKINKITLKVQRAMICSQISGYGPFADYEKALKALRKVLKKSNLIGE